MLCIQGLHKTFRGEGYALCIGLQYRATLHESANDNPDHGTIDHPESFKAIESDDAHQRREDRGRHFA